MSARKEKILIVEDDQFLREQLWFNLKADHTICQAADGPGGLEAVRKEKPDLVLLDLHLPPSGSSREGLNLLREIRRKGFDSAVIVMTGDQKKESSFQAIEEGAYDYFRKPMDLDELKLIVRRALGRLRIERENRQLRERLRPQGSFEGIIGSSKAIRQVFDAIRRVAATDTTVLILGESGTGKELVARAIHNLSERKDAPFVDVQCSALPENLIESELFGRERGAYTGAVSSMAGRFEMAHLGTLFLDEIGTMSQALQSKLLRVLEQRHFQRLGGKETIQTNFRLITATNEDLETGLRDGTFREDLYFRIHVFPIRVPPLRERREDIPLLAEHFLKLFCASRGTKVKTLSRDAMDHLDRHSWRGNVRELENIIQTLVLTADGDRIQASDLPPHLMELTSEEIRRFHQLSGDRISLSTEVAKFESQLVQLALNKAGGVKVEAAQILGIDKNRMMYLCRKYEL